jgi:C4-type Zn-finger protein
MLKCECCGSTSIYLGWEQTEFPYRGYVVDVDSRYSSCDACGYEWVNPEQSYENKKLSAAAKEKIDNWILTEGVE